MFRPLLVYTFVFMAALALMPDAEADSSGFGVKEAASPSLEVSTGKFVSNAQSSCTDLVEAKATNSVAKTSVDPMGFVLPSLTLNLSKNDLLNVDSIRAVISDKNRNRAILELPTADVGDLLASENAVVHGPAKIVTDDPARNADPIFVPCGLTFGGINWLDTTSELKVVVSLIGSTEASNGDLAPFELSVETSVSP